MKKYSISLINIKLFNCQKSKLKYLGEKIFVFSSETGLFIVVGWLELSVMVADYHVRTVMAVTLLQDSS